MAEDAKRAWIEVALECGDDVPEPADDSPERLVVWVPEDLDRALQRQAAREDTTLGEFVVSTLAGAVAE